jgi:capsular exopolysaccharide synthesis family protein
MSVTHPGDLPVPESTRPLRAIDSVSPWMVFDVLRRRKLSFAIVASLVLAAGIVIILRTVPQYEARALVLVDTRKNALSDLQAISSGDLRSDAVQVLTQVDIIRSPALASQVATDLDLAHAPEFDSAIEGPPSLPRRLEQRVAAMLGFPPPPRPVITPAERTQLAAGILLNDKLSVINDGRSYVIGIQVRTQDPALAARIANAYARVYLDFNRALKDRAVTRADAWLAERVAPLQDKLRSAETAIADFRDKYGLIEDQATTGTNERRPTVAGQQLAQINALLVQATSDRVQKETSLAQIVAAEKGHGDLSSVPEVVASPLVQRLLAQQAEIAARIADMGTTQLSANPQIISLRAQQAAIVSRIATEVDKIVGSIRAEATAAAAREASLKQRLADAEAKVSQQSQAEIQLRALESEADAARGVYMDTLNKAEQTSNERDIQQPDAELISLAAVPLSPAPPTRTQYGLIAVLAALILGVVAAFLRERLERGFRSAEQLEEETGLPTIGFLPVARKPEAALAMEDQRSPYVEAINAVRGALLMSDAAGHPRVVLVTSALPREGKTFFAVSLARSVALAGGRSLLIDADLRRPSVARTAGITVQSSLNALVGTGGDHDAMLDRLIQRDDVTQLDIIPAEGNGNNVQDLVTSEALRGLVDAARSRYDLVVIDAPPVLAFVDARVLATVADATIMVVKWRDTPRTMVSGALKMLRGFGTRVAGTVLTQADLRALTANEGSHAYLYRNYGSYYQ